MRTVVAKVVEVVVVIMDVVVVETNIFIICHICVLRPLDFATPTSDPRHGTWWQNLNHCVHRVTTSAPVTHWKVHERGCGWESVMWERSCFWLNLLYDSFLTIMHKSGVGSVSLVSSRSKETLDYVLKI